MRSSKRYRISAALLAALALACVQAQEGFDEAAQDVDAMVEAVNDFVRDVRFTEADVESLIEHWDEFSAIGEAYEDEEDDIVDFDAILADAEYQDWADSLGLDAENWLRRTVRITMMVFREQMLAGAAMFPQQMSEQLAMIEQQREQLGEEMYLQMKAAMEQSAAYMQQLSDSAANLPEPTGAEAMALDRHRDTLMAMMDEGDGDDEYGEDDYEEYADDEGEGEGW